MKKALVEWNEEISDVLKGIEKEYEDVKRELQVYSYKFNITKQVVQSTINDEIIRNIREMYHKPFEQKLNEKRKVFHMFVDKIAKVSGIEEGKPQASGS